MENSSPSKPQPTVSVIFTVLNESSNVTRLLDSLASQTQQPDQVVICDGGSDDDTVSLIESFIAGGRLAHVKLIIEPGANISRGRNSAIAAADGPIIASTDVGVRLENDWLAAITKPWLDANSTRASTYANVTEPATAPIAVAGFFLPDVDSIFTAAMGATVLPLHDDIEPDAFLPSSRSVAFTKAAWGGAGGYPEWLDFCEDLLFDFAINAQRSPSTDPGRQSAFAWAPQAIAYFQPRTNLLSFWKQYYRYARGDGKADLWRKRHAARYITYLVVLPLLLASLFVGGAISAVGALLLVVGGVSYCFRPWQRLQVVGKTLAAWERALAFLWVPVIRVVGDVAKMVGYPIGLWWRWQNRDRPEVHWQVQEH